MCKQNNIEAGHIISVRYTRDHSLSDHSPRDILVISIATLSSHQTLSNQLRSVLNHFLRYVYMFTNLASFGIGR